MLLSSGAGESLSACLQRLHRSFGTSRLAVTAPLQCFDAFGISLKAKLPRYDCEEVRLKCRSLVETAVRVSLPAASLQLCSCPRRLAAAAAAGSRLAAAAAAGSCCWQQPRTLLPQLLP